MDVYVTIAMVRTLFTPVNGLVIPDEQVFKISYISQRWLGGIFNCSKVMEQIAAGFIRYGR